MKAVAIGALGAALIGAPLRANASDGDVAFEVDGRSGSATSHLGPNEEERPLDLTLRRETGESISRRATSTVLYAPERFDGAPKVALRVGAGTIAGLAIVNRLYPGQRDKRLHAIAGGVIAGVTSEFVVRKTENRVLGAAAGCAAAFAAGVLKERYDAGGRGTVDRRDAIATGLGGLPVCASYAIEF